MPFLVDGLMRLAVGLLVCFALLAMTCFFCVFLVPRRSGACRRSACRLPFDANAGPAGDKIGQVAVVRGGQQAGDEVLEVAGFPVGLAEGAAEQSAGFCNKRGWAKSGFVRIVQ